MADDRFKVTLSKGTQILLQTAAIAAAFTAIGAGYVFFLNYVWKPDVEVLEADFNLGVAKVKVGRVRPKILEINGDTTYQILGEWGIRFGTIIKESGETVYNRIELIRKGMVYQYLNK